MKFTKEIKIATIAVLGIIVLYFGMNFLKGMSLFSNDNRYYIRFNNISGLSASNPIFADGYQVGVVKGINYDYQHNGAIVVTFDVDNNLRIPKGSSAEIVSDLMGNIKMNLLLANNPRERVNPGDTIVGTMSKGIMNQAATLIPQFEKILPKVDSIMSSLNTLLADPALAQSLHNVRHITSDLTTSTRELNLLLAQLNHDVPGMVGKANGVLDNTNRLTANLAAVDISSTMNQVNQTLANVKAFTESLNNKNGTLGLLMNDPGLYNNMNSTMSSADSLLKNVREHPKRYVHFSLFGKKDK
jgi:phospholipid/cholesterol/gamma-HCH transport system substrate-binding protein